MLLRDTDATVWCISLSKKSWVDENCEWVCSERVGSGRIVNYKLDKVSDALSEGARVWVKVIGISDDDQKKISLSMKLVDQSTGQDLVSKWLSRDGAIY